MLRTRIVPGVLIALLLSAGLNAEAPRPFADLAQLDSAVASLQASGDADAFWHRVTAAGPLPLVFEETVVFLYRGEAESVEWRGGFNGWGQAGTLTGRRLGDSDVWMARRDFLPASRVDYKIVVDGDRWLLDPLNPHRQVGGYGPNSELRMPGWTPPTHTERRPEVERGDFSQDRWIASAVLGYDVRYRVWSPPGWSPGGDGDEPRRLPVLYVTDGSDYWNDDMGSLVVTLDNLTAEGSIGPLLVVFVDPWDRRRETNRREAQYLPDAERRCPFCRFLADELIPAVDAAYPTLGATRRGLLGTSFGGLHATYTGLRRPRLFTHLGIQSPALHPAPWLLDELAADGPFPPHAFLAIGAYEGPAVEQAHRLRDLLRARGTQVRYTEPPEDHSWGQWRAQLDDVLRWFASADAAPVAASRSDCPPVPGLSPVLAPRTVLLLGELHGTREVPAFVDAVVCHALAEELPVLVGLEIPQAETDRVAAYLASDGGAAAEAALLAGPLWQSEVQYGVASRAMLRLLDSVRKRRAAGAPVDLELYDPGQVANRDRGMAANLAAALTARPQAFAVVLSGNLHNRMTVGTSFNAELEPMGYLLRGRLKDRRIVSLNLAHQGGTAWLCFGSTAEDCGMQEVGGRAQRTSGVELDAAAEDAPYHGRFFTGPVTASPPAARSGAAP